MEKRPEQTSQPTQSNKSTFNSSKGQKEARKGLIDSNPLSQGFLTLCNLSPTSIYEGSSEEPWLKLNKEKLANR